MTEKNHNFQKHPKTFKTIENSQSYMQIQIIAKSQKKQEISIFQRVFISKRVYFGPFCKEGTLMDLQTFLKLTK